MSNNRSRKIDRRIRNKEEKILNSSSNRVIFKLLEEFSAACGNEMKNQLLENLISEKCGTINTVYRDGQKYYRCYYYGSDGKRRQKEAKRKDILVDKMANILLNNECNTPKPVTLEDVFNVYLTSRTVILAIMVMVAMMKAAIHQHVTQNALHVMNVIHAIIALMMVLVIPTRMMIV